MTDERTPQQIFDAALDELPAKQRKFVVEYLRDLHQRNAATRAGYSEKTADVQASQILRKLKVQQAVQAGMALYAMPAAEVLYRLTEQARATMDDFLDVAGGIDLVQARERGKLHLVKARAVTKEGERIELYDSQAALVQLGKHYKLWTDVTQVQGEIGYKVYERSDGFDPDSA
jgi:phage terminase small subunit